MRLIGEASGQANAVSRSGLAPGARLRFGVEKTRARCESAGPGAARQGSGERRVPYSVRRASAIATDSLDSTGLGAAANGQVSWSHCIAHVDRGLRDRCYECVCWCQWWHRGADGRELTGSYLT
jgi:hypothetical protein